MNNREHCRHYKETTSGLPVCTLGFTKWKDPHRVDGRAIFEDQAMPWKVLCPGECFEIGGPMKAEIYSIEIVHGRDRYHYHPQKCTWSKQNDAHPGVSYCEWNHIDDKEVPWEVVCELLTCSASAFKEPVGKGIHDVIAAAIDMRNQARSEEVWVENVSDAVDGLLGFGVKGSRHEKEV